MTDNEKRELDRWLEWAGGEVFTWTGKDGVPKFDARARKDGQVVRIIEGSRHEAIERLKVRYYLTGLKFDAPPKTRCASCPQDAVEEFKVRCSDADAANYGVTLTGTWVDTAWDGSPIREETVGLCARCMAGELRRFLAPSTDIPHWLKIVRAGP